MNIIDGIRQSDMPMIGKIPAEMGMNLVAVVTGVASVAFESLKLALSIPTAILAKYIVMGSLRLITCDHFEALKKGYDALPGFMDCLDTAGKIVNQFVGIIPSVVGTVLPVLGSAWNVKEQHRLGNCQIDRLNKNELREKLKGANERNDKLFELEQQIKDTKQQIKTLTDKLPDVPFVLYEDDSAAAFQDRLNHLAKLNEPVDKLKQKLAELENEHKIVADKIASQFDNIENDLSQKRKDMITEVLNNEIEKLLNVVKKLDAENTMILEENQKACDETIENYNNVKILLKKKIADLKADNLLLNQKIKSDEGEIVKLKAAPAALEQINKLKQDNATLTSTLDEYAKKSVILGQKNMMLNEKNITLEKQLKEKTNGTGVVDTVLNFFDTNATVVQS